MLYCAFNVLYFSAHVQAQIQTLEITSDNEIIQSSEHKTKPKLYVEQKPEQKQGLPEIENENEMPPDLAIPTETDEEAQQQIDRVFENYKALAEKQKKAAQDMPMRSEPVSKSGNLQKSTPAAGGIAGILQQYQKGKDAPVQTNSLTITDPDHYSGKNK